MHTPNSTANSILIGNWSEPASEASGEANSPPAPEPPRVASGPHHYRKKPIVVEAQQFFKDKPLPFNERGPVVAYDGADGEATGFYVTTVHDQKAYLDDGDWVILESRGRYAAYPCKPDIFAATYEPVESSPRVASGDELAKVLFAEFEKAFRRPQPWEEAHEGTKDRWRGIAKGSSDYFSSPRPLGVPVEVCEPILESIEWVAGLDSDNARYAPNESFRIAFRCAVESARRGEQPQDPRIAELERQILDARAQERHRAANIAWEMQMDRQYFQGSSAIGCAIESDETVCQRLANGPSVPPLYDQLRQQLTASRSRVAELEEELSKLSLSAMRADRDAHRQRADALQKERDAARGVCDELQEDLDESRQETKELHAKLKGLLNRACDELESLRQDKQRLEGELAEKTKRLEQAESLRKKLRELKDNLGRRLGFHQTIIATQSLAEFVEEALKRIDRLTAENAELARKIQRITEPGGKEKQGEEAKCPTCGGTDYEVWSEGRFRCTIETPAGGPCGTIYRSSPSPDLAADVDAVERVFAYLSHRQTFCDRELIGETPDDDLGVDRIDMAIIAWPRLRGALASLQPIPWPLIEEEELAKAMYVGYVKFDAKRTATRPEAYLPFEEAGSRELLIALACAALSFIREKWQAGVKGEGATAGVAE